jgi:hypothetical protein
MFESREIDILIDKVTACLVERASGKRVETEVSEVSFERRPSGWKFDWSKPGHQGSSISALCVNSDPEEPYERRPTMDNNSYLREKLAAAV